MNVGKVFETQFKKSVPNDIYFMRIKDNPSSFSPSENNVVRFTPKNPYDNFMFYNGKFFPFELKSTSGSALSIQRDKTEKGKMIKLHQINGLSDASTYNGIYAGFVFDFRTSNNTYFIDIKHFNRFLSETDKKSINENDVIKHNGILLEKQKKKVHYTYDILKMLNEIVSNNDK